MNIMQKILLIITLIASLNTNAALGPIPIYLNTEYRTDSPVIGSIASTLSFSADDIKATGANTFLDFLATVPSVGLYNPYGNVAALFMRGGDSDHTLVLVDGVSVNSIDSLNGAVEYGLTSIALNDIEKIEIIKNSGSVLYGSSAISGVINITTKKGADGASATLGIKFGTHNSKTYTLSANNGGKDGFVRFTHNKYTTDGINAQTGDTTGEKDSINNQTTQIKAGNKHFDIGYLESRNKTQYDGFSGTDAEFFTKSHVINSMAAKLIVFDVAKSCIDI
jgi:vitamin B12 transporter